MTFPEAVYGGNACTDHLGRTHVEHALTFSNTKRLGLPENEESGSVNFLFALRSSMRYITIAGSICVNNEEHRMLSAAIHGLFRVSTRLTFLARYRMILSIEDVIYRIHLSCLR